MSNEETFRDSHVRAMERQVIELTFQRDELLAIVRRMARWDDTNESMFHLITDAQAAIAKAEGRANE